MGWIGGALLVWFAVSLVAAPLIGVVLRRLGQLNAGTSAADAPAIDLRRSDGIRPSVLIVDPQPIRRLTMASTLGVAGFDVVDVGRPHLALTSDVVDVVIVDDECAISTADALKRVRRRHPNVAPPVLMMQAPEDPAAWTRAGADDYLIKPFEFEELLARIEALGRRGREQTQPVSSRLVVADLELDRASMRVSRAGKAITLTARELALLELLMSAPGRLFSRERILANVWGTNEDPLTNVVDVYIRRLRSKIDEGHERALIHTQRGLGYRLEDVGPSSGVHPT